MVPRDLRLVMFLSVKEMEVRKIRFDETFRAGQIDFAGDQLEQESLLRAAGEAALVPHSSGEVRIRGRYSVEISAACDRCLERTRYPLEASFDLYYRPAETIAREEEVGIDEAEAEIGFYEGGGSSWKMFSASRFCWLCLCSESAGKIARAFARRAARTGIRVRAIVRWKMRRAAGRHSEIWRFPRDGTSLRG
jgi:hypothetical protein